MLWDWSWIEAKPSSLVMMFTSLFVLYLLIGALVRVFGLRSFAKISGFDFPITVAMGSLLAAVFCTKEPQLALGALGLFGMFLFQYTVGWLRVSSRRARAIIDNKPLLLMYGDTIYTDRLKRVRLTEDDIRAKLREANVLRRGEVRAVVMETTGDISVLHGAPDGPELDLWLLDGVEGVPEEPGAVTMLDGASVASRGVRWLVALAVGASMLLGSVGAGAQGMSGGGSSEAIQGKRSGSALETLSDVLDATGEVLVNMFRKREDKHNPDNPRWDSYISPRHTVMTFREAMGHVRFGREDCWPRALGAMGVEEDNADAREAARHLRSIFERLAPIRSTDLPGKTLVQERELSRYEVFPYGLPHQRIWRELGEAPEGMIVLVEREPGRWVFSWETVRGAERLAESLESIPPYWEDKDARGAIVVRVFSPLFGETPWWGWLVAVSTLAVGVVVMIYLHKGLTWVANELEMREVPVGAELVRSGDAPIAFLLLTLGSAFGSAYLEFGPTLETLRWAILRMMALVTVAWVFVELIDLGMFALQRFAERRNDSFQAMAYIVFRRGLRVAITLVLAVFILQDFLGVDVTALVTTLGVAGLALSLAAQGPLKNFFGAMTIFVNKPFVVGDWISFKGEIGEIEDVGLQTTRMRLLSGEQFVVPNMEFINHAVENLAARRYFRREMNLSLPYDCSAEDLKRAADVVDDVLRGDEVANAGNFDLEERPPEISVNAFESYYINLRAYYWYFITDEETTKRDASSGWYAYLQHCGLVNRKLKEAFEERGLSFAFPTEDVRITHLTQEGELPAP